jgi:hypothetical protein
MWNSTLTQQSSLPFHSCFHFLCLQSARAVCSGSLHAAAIQSINCGLVPSQNKESIYWLLWPWLLLSLRCVASSSFLTWGYHGICTCQISPLLLPQQEVCKPILPGIILTVGSFLSPTLFPAWEVLWPTGYGYKFQSQAGRLWILTLLLTSSVILSKLTILGFSFLIVRGW